MISGWDIGGAHIKVVRYDEQGELGNLIQVPCPLWLGISQLQQAVENVLAQLANQTDITAITMTGELVDIFADRQTGVSTILDCLANYIAPELITVYGGDQGWLNIQQAALQWQTVASRNWQVSASLAASQQQQGIFIDIGSTSCDIIVLANGQAQPQGSTDFERQACGELLYTGCIRTPLIAISQTAPFAGQLISLAAELFASTGDIWCLLDQLDPTTIQDNSADSQPWDKQFCAARLARLLGTDHQQASLSQWQQLAQWFAQQQCHLVVQAVLQVISAHPDLADDAPIIGAGVGRFIAKLCAQRLQRAYQPFHHLLAMSNSQVSDHAPAVALALLAQQQAR